MSVVMEYLMVQVGNASDLCSAADIVGTVRPVGGLQIWQDSSHLGCNGNGTKDGVKAVHIASA